MLIVMGVAVVSLLPSVGDSLSVLIKVFILVTYADIFGVGTGVNYFTTHIPFRVMLMHFSKVSFRKCMTFNFIMQLTCGKASIEHSSPSTVSPTLLITIPCVLPPVTEESGILSVPVC